MARPRPPQRRLVLVRKHLVLVVDDEEPVFHALSRELRSENCELIYASCGEDALAALENRSVDVIICDQRMPGMTGVELLKSVSTRYPGIVRVLLTGHACLRVAMEAINRGAVFRILTKPWQPEELRAVYREAVRHRAAAQAEARG